MAYEFNVSVPDSGRTSFRAFATKASSLTIQRRELE